MAALEFLPHMSGVGDSIDPTLNSTSEPAPTYAAFSPGSTTSSSSFNRRTTILIHQKSPLLIATPPQITRALAYSHPFLLPLNKFVGLVSWTTGDPWESFLLVAFFWIATLYGDDVLRYAGPLVFASILTLAMYSRRWSPLSSTGWVRSSPPSRSGAKAENPKEDEQKIKHQKSLDEIVETLKLFTSRCNILLDPWLRMTDFLSSSRTPTSASTREALTVIFIRLLFVTPVWFLLTLPPLYILTTRRVILAAGTLFLSWHSRPARVSRAILWRSTFVRRTASVVIGLDFGEAGLRKSSNLPPRGSRNANHIAAALAARRSSTAGGVDSKAGIRFTFTIWENQRRWIGIGWTHSMLAYERAAWTDEQLNPADPKESFRLPDVEGGMAVWRWVPGSEWRVDMNAEELKSPSSPKDSKGKSTPTSPKPASNEDEDSLGWIYYDNKWRDGRRGQETWGRYTRRRKWYRDAELVEISRPPSPAGSTTSAAATIASSVDRDMLDPTAAMLTPNKARFGHARGESESSASTRRSGGWFRRRRALSNGSTTTVTDNDGSVAPGSPGAREDSDDGYVPLRYRGRATGAEADWGVGEDAGMELG